MSTRGNRAVTSRGGQSGAGGADRPSGRSSGDKPGARTGKATGRATPRTSGAAARVTPRAGVSGTAGGARTGSARRQPPRTSQPRTSQPQAQGGGRSASRNNSERGLGGEQVEGRQAVRELLMAARRRVREVMLANDIDDATVIAEIVELCIERRVPVRRVSRLRIEQMAKSDAPQGVIAQAAPLPEADLADLLRPFGDRAPFLLALDGVTDPHNLGALVRTGECAGVTGIILPRHRSAHVTPTAAKASAGAVEHVPMVVVSGLPNALAICQEAGVWTVGLDPEGDVDIADLPVADQPVLLVLGAEGAGLSRLTRQRCDVLARIPQYGKVASLNVAAAGAIACFAIAQKRDAQNLVNQI